VISDALARLTKHSAIYALGPFAQRAIGFLLLPFVTAYIGTTSNYGVVEMSATWIAFASQLLGINLLYGMARFYPEYGTEEERGRLVSTCFALLAASTGTALIAAIVFRESGAELLLGSSRYGDALVAIAAILFLQTLGQVGLRWLQILQRSIAYGVLTTVKTLLEVGLKVWFLAGIGLTFMGVLGSVLGGEAAVAAGIAIWILRRTGFAFSGTMAKRLVRFSYPLILGGLPMFALHQADRAFVLHYHGEDGVGLYGLAYKLGSMANVVFVEAFGLIWFPYIFGVKDEESRRAICRAVLRYFTALMSCASLALAVFSPEILRVMADAKFFAAHRALPLIAAGYLCWAVFQIVQTAFYVRERTGLLSVLIGCAALWNLAWNQALVPSMGYMGAAWATLATFAPLAVAAWILAERTMRVGYEVGRILLPVLLAGAIYAASPFLPFAGGVLGTSLRAIFVLALPVALWTGGFVRPEEKVEIRTAARGLAASFKQR